MARTLAAIGEADVFADGLIIAAQDSSIKLTPFPDQPAYTVEIVFIVEDEPEHPLQVTGEAKEHYYITWKMRWTEDASYAHIGMDFANSQEYNYKISAALRLIGVRERYAVNFQYVLLREAKI